MIGQIRGIRTGRRRYVAKRIAHVVPQGGGGIGGKTIQRVVIVDAELVSDCYSFLS